MVTAVTANVYVYCGCNPVTFKLVVEALRVKSLLAAETVTLMLYRVMIPFWFSGAGGAHVTWMVVELTVLVVTFSGGLLGAERRTLFNEGRVRDF